MKNFISISVLYCLVITVVGQQEVTTNEDTIYQTRALELHNEYRGKHGATPLTVKEDLNKRAKQCAEYYLSKMVFDMSCPFKTSSGENLYAMSGSGGRNSSVMNVNSVTQRAVESWYIKSSTYDFATKKLQPKAGQFTQMVWKGTREFGFGVALGNGVAVAIGLYSPPGNVVGHFNENVGSLI
ncbi:Golgi-associated plant pathogenesis-related protein 1 [Orchesella cincta]|uniref:Golgi-associated plant pathogenesis-related protein 1 n=1 Tax=Orchesella cincta TaxID=48709 RepID=A0A1D2N7Q5_ORCCI|nr:Golgi-associated plant pathogenesis-related protein 1 [Orchesella cincta]